MRLLPCGVDAVLLEFADGTEALAYQAGLAATPIPGVVETIPASRTLLLRADTPSRMRDIVAAAREITPRPPTEADAREVVIETRYDGEDLADAAELLGWSPEELVRRHTAATWTVAFCGFSPGFAYIVSPEATWGVPRRSSPRTRVPAGAVALAGDYTGVYPTPSPGGWQLIGSTEAPLWDTDREPPALLLPGTTVRFVDITGRAS